MVKHVFLLDSAIGRLFQRLRTCRLTEILYNYDKIIHDELAGFRVAGWQRLIAAQVGNRTGLNALDCGCGILRAVGFEDISYDRDITGPLWDDKEKLIYGNTPMFMLRAIKPETT